jgi:hypothetical protein
MRDKGANPDMAVAEIAARQHGVVSTRQLLAAGLSRSAIERRVRAGRLHRLHQGVYAVGHRGISRSGAWIAALLAVGGDAVLSHQSAATLFELLSNVEPPVHVSVSGTGGKKVRSGIKVHRRASLPPGATTRHRGLPATTPARTLRDVRGFLTPARYRQAVRQAAVLGLALGPEIGVDRTRSELEFHFLELCRHFGLPLPEVNVRVGAAVVDFLWRERRLIVETDGYRYHRGSVAFEEDRDRDLRLRSLGFEVIRLSYRQVAIDPAATADLLRAVLAP